MSSGIFSAVFDTETHASSRRQLPPPSPLWNVGPPGRRRPRSPAARASGFAPPVSGVRTAPLPRQRDGGEANARRRGPLRRHGIDSSGSSSKSASALQGAAASIGLRSRAAPARVGRARALPRGAGEVLVSRAARAAAVHRGASVAHGAAGAAERARRARGPRAAHVRVRRRVARQAARAVARERPAAAVVVGPARVAARLAGAAGHVGAGVRLARRVVALARAGRPGRAHGADLAGSAPAVEGAARAVVEARAALARVARSRR